MLFACWLVITLRISIPLKRCCDCLRYMQVLSPLFDFHGRVTNTNNRELRITEAMSYVTIHKVEAPKMTEYYDFWQRRVKPWWDAGAGDRGK